MYLTSYDDYASEFITGKADQSVIIITWKKTLDIKHYHNYFMITALVHR